VKNYGAWAIFGISAVPNPVHLPMTIAVGTLKFPPPRWFLLTLAGNVVKDAYIAFAGYFGVNALLHWIGA
jgi:membrane protein DedA with SNARE-associated domain